VSVQPGAVRPSGSTAEAVTQVAADHQLEQAALSAATLAAILAIWAQMDPLDWLGSWFRRGLGTRIFTLLSVAQEEVAMDAEAFMRESLEIVTNAPVNVPRLRPIAFAGVASDGRDLESLLASAPIQAFQRAQRGDPPAVASEAGANFLRAAVTTQISDAGRAADQVALATTERMDIKRPGRRSRYNARSQFGYVRMLQLPSCARCIVLAGRFYRWNEGFQRHPMCDCRHIPAIEALDDDLAANPYAYFNSLSTKDQNDIFGKANATAIRAGADISQVLNAVTRFNPRTGRTALLKDPSDGRRYTTEGTTRRGFYGRNAAKERRPTPWQILRDSRGNQDEARRALVKFGYILA
jgi:hypothetical protein